MRQSARVVLLVTLAAVVALVPACGDDKDGEAGKPEVEVPSGDPPKTLEKKDIKVGSGDEALAGQTVTVHYVGVSYSTKKQFDASWDGGSPFTFPLGAGRVIPGWDQGVPGMKVGGRRQLVIPPDLAYGPEGYPPAIAPNETLVFVVDLVSVKQ
jgi:FKBP-type peptidyl-prolyl cis-trans isomerase